MFATLKYHPQSSMSEVGNPVPRRASVNISRLACVNCRQKKLRCSDGYPACERCLLKGLECTYPKRAARASTKKNATASSESAADGKDASKSPDSRNQPSESLTDQTPDVLDTVPSRSHSADPENSFPTCSELQLFGTTSPVEGGLDCEAQSPTPAYSSDKSTRDIRSAFVRVGGASAETDTAFDLSANDYDFSPVDVDIHHLDNCFSPLASTAWCDDWLDPTWLQDTARPRSTAPEPADAHSKTDQASTPTLSKCNCVQLAIKTLEEAAAWTEADDFQLAQSALAAHKDALTQCEAWLACTRCTSPSSIVMLVLVITDKLIASFRRIHAFSQSSWVSASDSSREALVLGHGVCLGDYQIESGGEWSRVMNVLLESQLLRLNRLFQRVWASLGSSSEESQVQIIQQQEDRLRTLINHFERSAPFSVS